MTDIRIDIDGNVLTVIIDRPAKKNAITSQMYDALTKAIREANALSAIHAILLCGEGSDFCAGNDIADFVSRPQEAGGAAIGFIKALAENNKPLVAEVQGGAVGIGATMLLHCDFVFASPVAYFRFPFIDLGLTPEAGASLLLPRRAGPLKAAEWLMLGQPFDAGEALRHGLLTQVCEAPLLHATARATAEALARKPSAALAEARRLLTGDRAALMRCIDDEAMAFAKALASPEARNAFRHFLERDRA